MATRRQSQEPLLVTVHLDVQGANYALDVRSELRLEQAFPEAHGLPMVFLGYDNDSEFEQRHRPYWEMVGQLLTDLTPEQIGQLGGMRFYEPLNNSRVIWEWIPGKTEISGLKARLIKVE